MPIRHEILGFVFALAIFFFYNVLAAAVAVPSAVGLFKLTEKWTSRGRVLRFAFCVLVAAVLYVLMYPLFGLVLEGFLSPGGYL